MRRKETSERAAEALPRNLTDRTFVIKDNPNSSDIWTPVSPNYDDAATSKETISLEYSVVSVKRSVSIVMEFKGL